MAPDPNRRNQHSYGAILDATIDQLCSVGYHRLTIERVANQAGVGKATVYRWWPSKAQLAVEALSQRYQFEPVVQTGDLRGDVQALVRRTIDFVTKTPIGYALPQLASELADEPEAKARLVKWLGPTRAGHLAVLYGAAGRADLPHDIDANLLLDVIAGTVFYRNLLGQPADDRLVEQLANLIVDRDLPRMSSVDRLV